jgi:hypothetical protein
MIAVSILLAPDDFFAYTKMNNCEEEMKADYSRTVTAVSRCRFRLGTLSC